jgi:hypothetical protein
VKEVFGVAMLKKALSIALLVSSISTAYALDNGRYNIVSSGKKEDANI